jgi:hypothetical protein
MADGDVTTDPIVMRKQTTYFFSEICTLMTNLPVAPEIITNLFHQKVDDQTNESSCAPCIYEEISSAPLFHIGLCPKHQDLMASRQWFFLRN